MRAFLLMSLLVLLAGCPQGTTADAAGGDDNGNEPDPTTQAFCIDDMDCELARRTCCECPTFALAAGDPKLDACSGVMCPPPQNTCSKIHAVCENNQCAVACEPTVVTRECANGFATDAAGCLIDACAAATTPTCTKDNDCVETRADCCGCARGGNDTAVPAAQRASFDASLGCSGSESCPEVDTCVAGETPQCAQGKCKLIAGGLPADACGRPDLASCTNGTVCTVNANDPANKHGVGVCR
ncbi:MAG: hypothetical protein M4D80_36405 [Myxococcota bacterium]|nr:hypothetical protein [Myxococcota bacterium]